MGFWESLFRSPGKVEKREVYTIPAKDYVPSFSMLSGAGIPVNHKTALKFSAVFAAIRIHAENLASLPKNVFEDTPQGKKSRLDHPAYRLIHFKPNPLQNDFVFWEYMGACLNGWGNAYAIIETKNGYPVALWPVHPSEVTRIVNKKELYFEVTNRDFAGTYSSGEVLDFKMFTLDGINGVDPVTFHALSIGIGLAGNEYAAEFFSKKGNIKSVLEADNAISDKAYDSIQKRLAAAGNHGTPLFDYGVKYKTVGISPDAAQVIQTRAFQIQDVARIWNIPPHMLADLSRSTFSNIEHQDIQFVKYSMRPSVKRIETELESKLFLPSELGSLNIKFNLDGLLRGDMKTRAAFYHFGIQDGWLSRNEVRDMENRNPVDGLDEMLVPQNMIDNSMLNDGQNNNANNQNSGNE